MSSSSGENTASAGRAAVSLLRQLADERELRALHSNQAASLKQLVSVRNALTGMNRYLVKEYANTAPEITNATRLAAQVASDLEQITSRVRVLKRKVEMLKEIESRSARQGDEQVQE